MDLFTIISKLENNQYASIEEFEKDIRLIFRNCYIYNDIGKLVTKQIRILEQNKDKSQISLSSANEPVLQAIVENLLPLKYCIPELLLVMDRTKLKGFGRFGYSDIFILKGIGNNNISLELKYIPLVGLIKNQKKEV
ncbi:unnamed protein product [Rhizophagus irregularis]|nr:unnamed protein product [Rhizophagus irregularis]